MLEDSLLLFTFDYRSSEKSVRAIHKNTFQWDSAAEESSRVSSQLVFIVFGTKVETWSDFICKSPKLCFNSNSVCSEKSLQIKPPAERRAEFTSCRLLRHSDD